MLLQFGLQPSLWPAIRFAFHAARDAFVISEASRTAHLTVETSISDRSFSYEVGGEVEALLRFIDLLLSEGVLRFNVRLETAAELRQLRARFPTLEAFPSQIRVLPPPGGEA